MKKLISTLTFVFAIGLISISAQCCSGSKTKTDSETKVACNQTQEATDVKAYYFHATRRCATRNNFV